MRAALVLLLTAVAVRAEGPHAREAALHAGEAPTQPIVAVQVPAARLTTPVVTKRVYGYVPYWVVSTSSSFNAFVSGTQWDLLTDVIAFSVEVGTDGTISNPNNAPYAALASAAQARGVKAHLCATLFNSSGGSEIATFVASATARATAIQQLVSLAQSASLDGLNLDFEYVPSASRDAFTSFVQQLHSALHAALPAAELTLAMPATTSYSGYDTAQLAAASERLLLMEYDYHWRTGPTAGPSAPLPSVQSAVDGFLSLAPAASIAMGVPYYGYDWPTSSPDPGAAATGAGTSILLRNVYASFTTYGRLWDSSSQTPWFRYTGHQGWCDDDQSLALKYQLVNDRKLAGVMIWALSYDSGRAEAWNALRTAFTGQGTGGSTTVHDGPQGGCTEASATWLALAGLIAAFRRTRRRRTSRDRTCGLVLERTQSWFPRSIGSPPSAASSSSSSSCAVRA